MTAVRLVRAVSLAAVLHAAPARAHHGVASVGFAGSEGPGAAIETASANPLPARTLLVLAKSEWAQFRKVAFAEPENKDHFSFTTLGVGYGIRPWLTAYAFAPWQVKAQGTIGTSSGPGDPTLMLSVGFKWDEGLRLVHEKESVDELADWHFSAWASSSIPLGSTTRTGAGGAPFEPEMQTGFGAPSPTAGLAATKQLTRDLTVLAELSHQRLFVHTYSGGLRYRFGAETRGNAALAWRAVARPGLRVDLVGELNGLRLERDEASSETGEPLAPVEASGGAVLYAGGGVRASFGALGLALGARRAAARSLNEAAGQQGSEGLEAFRATASLSWAVGL